MLPARTIFVFTKSKQIQMFTVAKQLKFLFTFKTTKIVSHDTHQLNPQQRTAPLLTFK